MSFSIPISGRRTIQCITPLYISLTKISWRGGVKKPSRLEERSCWKLRTTIEWWKPLSQRGSEWTADDLYPIQREKITQRAFWRFRLGIVKDHRQASQPSTRSVTEKSSHQTPEMQSWRCILMIMSSKQTLRSTSRSRPCCLVNWWMRPRKIVKRIGSLRSRKNRKKGREMQ